MDQEANVYSCEYSQGVKGLCVIYEQVRCLKAGELCKQTTETFT